MNVQIYVYTIVYTYVCHIYLSMRFKQILACFRFRFRFLNRLRQLKQEQKQ